MKKTIFKHIVFINLFVFLILLVWLFFIFNFFSYKVKKETYPLISNSSQILTEIVTKEAQKDKTNNFLFDMKQSGKIFDFSVSDKEKNSYFIKSLKEKNFIISLLKFSYPIKQNGQILGYVEVWPKLDLFSTILSKRINLIIILLSLLFAVFVLVFVSYLYIKRNIFYPISKISKITEAISNQQNYDFNSIENKSLWKDVFDELKILNSKVIDIKTIMKLILSVSNVVTSDIELSNMLHLLFDIFQQKVNNKAVFVLFLLKDNAELKVFAKDAFVNSKVLSISEKTNSIVWKCYKEQKDYIFNDISLLPEYDKKILTSENIQKLINIPLIVNNNDKYCIGVVSVGLKIDRDFNKNMIGIIKEVADCFSALIFYRENYLKIKEQNRKLEMEIQNVSKEFVNKNIMLVQKVRNINAFCDIASYASENSKLEKIVSFITEKIKTLLTVETAGVFIYNSKDESFYTVGGSFGINNVITTNNNAVLYKVYEEKTSIIVQSKEEFKKYSKSKSLDSYLNVKSFVASPVVLDGSVIAVIMAVNKVGMKFSEYDVSTLEQLSSVISLIINKINLYNITKNKD